MQQVRRLRAGGHTVEACSPAPSAAHHHLALKGPSGAAALGRLMRGFDRTIVHFHPDVFYKAPSDRRAPAATEGFALRRRLPSSPARGACASTSSTTAGATRADPSSVATRSMLRGADPGAGAHGRAARPAARALRPAARAGRARRPRRRLRARTRPPTVRRARAGARASRATSTSSSASGSSSPTRASTGPCEPSPGSPTRAPASTSSARCGSTTSTPLDHVDELRPAAARDRRRAPPPRVRERRALRPLDRRRRHVVLPYRHIWSSSVAERAALLGRPVIATHVGGLADQVGAMPGAVLVDDNAALAAAMARAVGPPTSHRPPQPLAGGRGRRSTGLAGCGRVRAAVVRGGPSAARPAPPGQRRRFAAPSAPLRRLRPLDPAGARLGPAGRQRAETAGPPGRRMGGRPAGRPAQRLQRATTEAIDAQTDLLADPDR